MVWTPFFRFTEDFLRLLMAFERCLKSEKRILETQSDNREDKRNG